MTNTRLSIPAKLERDLMVEAGYMCAICKATEPLEIEHIEEYSKVNEHLFENMVVLCANCHHRKEDSSNPRHINKASLKAIKEKLMFLNGRYTDMEKRFIQECQKHLTVHPESFPEMFIHHTMYLQMKYLIDDGYVNAQRISGGFVVSDGSGTTIHNDQIKLALNQSGKSFILGLVG